ncbi:iron complex transport system ATP-binding protein [Haladaptatus litoreus]|uniref:Cobalamin import ATP-binding protein BtuD n=1 Tax=Haladaptatus litoreus TaxID=553468 RepID=A0A1N7E0H7_9EURY|nr:iron complex transport system ATP-binding protein [Haladaptatus litoreus]
MSERTPADKKRETDGGMVAEREKGKAGEEQKPENASELRGVDLEIGYPNSGIIVECESIVVPAGEITALVGPNGSGKSTLLKAMSRELHPESGVVQLDGEDVHSLGTKTLARKLGLLSQENESPGNLTVENLAYHGRYPHRGFFESKTEEDHEAVEKALELAGVTHLRDEEMGSLSGGQRQLAWIAMVLAQDTDVLLLDEPTTYLDLRHQLRVLEVVRTLAQEEDLTIGIVLHDISQAARYANNLVALRDGEPYDWGPPSEVVTEELLADVFGVEATVGIGPEGPVVTPRRPL